MAEAVLFSVVQSLITSIGSRALAKFSSKMAFRTEIDKLGNTINTIRDVMLDAEERQFESHAVRGWLQRLKPVVYAADDLFDEFATSSSQGKVLNFFSTSNPIAAAANVSGKIKKIREELDEIAKDSIQFGFVQRRDNDEARSNCRMRDQTHSFVNVNEVIGRDDDREAIIDTLMASCVADKQQLSIFSVVPIVGIGGLGKTTLAQLLYNDERVQKNFELRLWVCVSEVFDIKEVVKKILMSATNKESPNLEMDQLQGLLREEIGRKKYLLVLDDVWNEEPEKWRSLSALLNVGGEGSKIIVTTRSKKVAELMGTIPAFWLAGLSKENSWALFEKMAFHAGESQKKPLLVKLGEEIVRKCGGVPLALKALGTLLLGKEERKWILVAGTSFAKMHDTEINIMAILKLSYSHLLSPLKNCFAYCALFPKDYVFRKESLVDLWMAEGFVVPEYEAQSLKELGDEYLIVLLQRCFFQDVTTDEFGNIFSFKMHDLMHDLALGVSGTDSKMSKFQDTDFGDRILHLSFNYDLGMSWKIPSDMLNAKQLRTFLLAVEFRDGSRFNRMVLQRLISKFKCLRVLDLSNLGITTLPESIGELIHLRYLNLSKNLITELPYSITDLINMQTLILKFCYRLKTLPFYTGRLTNLRTLDVWRCYNLTHMPPGLGELTSLHKLPYFVVKSKTSPNFVPSQLRNLKTLNNLGGSLEIVLGERLDSEAEEAELIAKHGLSNLLMDMRGNDEAVLRGLKLPWFVGKSSTSGRLRDLKTLNNLSGSLEIVLNAELKDLASEAEDADLIAKHGLTDLIIEMRGIIGAISNNDEAVLEGLKPPPNLKKFEIKGYSGLKLPSWAMGDSLCMTLPHLVQICLVGFNECRQVPCFSQLPFLKRLTLQGSKVEYMEKSVDEVESPSTRRTFFPSLQELVLERMDNLKGWWEETKVVDCSDEGEISDTSTQSHPLPPSFSALIKLQIRHCHLLVMFPLSPNVEDLRLETVNKELTILKKVTGLGGNGDVGSSEYKSKLKRLNTNKVEILRSLPVECLVQLTSLEIRDSTLKNTSQLEEVFKHLSSLTSLKFSKCMNLTSISVGMEHLVSLASLILDKCWLLDISDKPEIEDDMPWKALTSLRALELQLNNLQHLPSGFQHLTNLRYLILSNNYNLEEVPEWIGCFSSLQSMKIQGCGNLRCLPKEVRKLTSLNELSILRCLGLTERCRGPNGADWPYIRHIPFLQVVGYDD